MKSFFILLKILKNLVEIWHKKKKENEKTYIDIHTGIFQI